MLPRELILQLLEAVVYTAESEGVLVVVKSELLIPDAHALIVFGCVSHMPPDTWSQFLIPWESVGERGVGHFGVFRLGFCRLCERRAAGLEPAARG